MKESPSNDPDDIAKKLERLLREEGGAALIRFFTDELGLSESTARSYKASWTDFRSWCEAQDRQVIPADPYALARYLEARSDLAIGTLRNRLSAIGAVHRHMGLENPTESDEVDEVAKSITLEKSSGEGDRSPAEKLEAGPYSPSEILKGGPDLLREYLEEVFGQEGSAQDEKRAASRSQKRERACSMWRDEVIEKEKASPELMTREQKKLIPDPEFDLQAMRDRACLLLMTEAKATRAEVARLDLIDVLVEESRVDTDLEEYLSEGGRSTKMEVWVGVRQTSGMPDRVLRLPEEEDLRFCPARAITAWVLGAGLSGGALLRPFGSHGRLKDRRIGPSSVNLLVRTAAEAAGLDPEDWTPSRLKEGKDAF